MHLTGTKDGPLVAPGDPIGHVQHHLRQVTRAAAERLGTAPTLPGAELVGERAFHAGLRRQAPTSCGGATRALRAMDGWFALTLARNEDLDLVPALTEGTCTRSADPWVDLARWARSIPTEELRQRCLTLGLPGRPVATAPSPQDVRRPGVVTSPGAPCQIAEVPLVVDLSSLWAGPLASHLLQVSGCHVVKVEGRRRPDGARRGSPGFFDVLTAGKQALTVDLEEPHEVAGLHALLQRADLVIEGSRPEALARRGLDAAALVRSGTSWLSITAEGRSSRAVGFGDDVAMGAGLVTGHGTPWPCGDALADPLTGVAAAAAATQALASGRAHLIDVSMLDVCRDALGDGTVPEHRTVRRHDRWWVETVTGLHPVLPPSGRISRHAAPAFGAHDHLWGEVVAQ